jgi:putative spermidine/putrescine transport system permease protein
MRARLFAGRAGRLRPEESSYMGSVLAWAIGVAMIFPLFIVAGLSLNETQFLEFPPKSLSLDWFDEVVNDPTWQDALRQSLVVAAVSAPIATALGAAAAIGIRNSRLANVFRILILLPLVVPVIVVALAIYPVFVDLNVVGSTEGLILGHALVALPYGFSVIWAAVATLDPRYERAAASLGAGPFTVLRRVTLPLIAPAILASLIVCVAVSFDEVVVSLYLSAPDTKTAPVVLWSNVRENLSPAVAAASVLIAALNLLILGAGVYLARWASRRRSQTVR